MTLANIFASGAPSIFIRAPPANSMVIIDGPGSDAGIGAGVGAAIVKGTKVGASRVSSSLDINGAVESALRHR